MQTTEIVINNTRVQGIVIPLQHAPLVLISTANGYLMCGFLNLEAAEKMGDCAAIIKGVGNVEEMLSRPVVAVTTAARKAGIEIGMIGREALEKLV